MKIQLSRVSIAVLLMLTCKKGSTQVEPCEIQPDSIAKASAMLTLPYAEKIMGEPGILTCNTFAPKADTIEYKCDYTATANDKVTGKTGKLYFMYEEYVSVVAAKNAYASIYHANNRHDGVKIVTGVGDEAYYHTDGTGFYFFLVRKNKKMFRLKLNKLTSHSSEKSFTDVTRLIADGL